MDANLKRRIERRGENICEQVRNFPHQTHSSCPGLDNPYSLTAIFGRGYHAIKAEAAVYVTRCASIEVVPRSQKNCTGVPAVYDGTAIFMDPISYVINSAGYQYTATM
jgi:hypothetical protein